jgi:signal transduction histidine kinase
MNLRSFHRTRATWACRPGGGAVALAALREAHHQALRTLAHDLRNPINSILLMAQLLEETGGTPEAARIAQRIQRQCRELSRMVDVASDKLPA